MFVQYSPLLKVAVNEPVDHFSIAAWPFSNFRCQRVKIRFFVLLAVIRCCRYGLSPIPESATKDHLGADECKYLVFHSLVRQCIKSYVCIIFDDNPGLIQRNWIEQPPTDELWSGFSVYPFKERYPSSRRPDHIFRRHNPLCMAEVNRHKKKGYRQ